MARDDRGRRVPDEPAEPVDVDELELDLDAEPSQDLDQAAREALAAVEGGPAGGEGGEDDVLKLQQEIADLRDRSIRTLADFDNFRKRAERDRDQARRYAAAEPLRDLLPVIDHFRLALDSGGSAEDLKRGLELILRQMEDLLRRHGVREVPALGERFDPSRHEAVAREESPAVAEPTVIEELRRGYLMHDRLLRPAMVRVAVPVEDGAERDADEPTN
jgi:molecular chaperone GrpE